MMKAILIDDDERNLTTLKEKLTRHCPMVTVIALCDSGEKGMIAIEELQPDLVFLDIEMPVMNGFNMLEQLSNRNFELIFVTAYDHYAIRAIRFSAIDYLLKPVNVVELTAAVDRSVQRIKQKKTNPQIEYLLELLHKKQKHIAIPATDGLQFISIDEIIYLEANQNYTHIFLPKQKFVVSRGLGEVEELLPSDTFIRIHHSYVVNKNAIDRYIRGEGGQVILKNGIALDVSKRRKLFFLQAINHK